MAGNATLTTNSSSGSISHDLWIQSFQTYANTQFDDNQVKRGISYRPIRRSEVFLNFTAIWSLQNYENMNQLQEDIRSHHILISQGDVTAMNLNYPGSNSDPVNLNYNGWIESADKEYVRFQDVFVRNYRMNILLPNRTTNIGSVSGIDPNYHGLISPNYIGFYGYNWYGSLANSNTSSVNFNPSSNLVNLKSIIPENLWQYISQSAITLTA